MLKLLHALLHALIIFTISTTSAFSQSETPMSLRVLPPGISKSDSDKHRKPLSGTLEGVSTATGYAFDEGYVRFNLSGTIRRQKIFGFKDLILAGCNTGDNLFAVTYDYANNGEIMFKDVVNINLTSGEFTTIAKLPEDTPTFLDMAYDNKHGNIFALIAKRGSSKPSLATMDKATGKLTILADFGAVYYSIACDGQGRIFLVEQSDGALSVIPDPLSDAKPLKVGGGNAKGAAYLSSMAFDQSAYKLYWAMCAADRKTYLVEINPATGLSRQIGMIGLPSDSREIMAMDIDRKELSEGVPSAPQNLIVEADLSGELSATLRWKNPEHLNASGEKTVLGVYLNGNLIKEYENPTEGSEMNLPLSDLNKGYIHIRIKAENAKGDGEPADAYVWIGHDVPKAVSGLRLIRNGTKAMLSWKAPEQSVHGGYMNPMNLKYRITRISSTGDSTVVAKTHRQTEFSEEIDSPDVYRYAVQALSTDYGETADSEPLYLGRAFDIPYHCDFSTEQSFNIWMKYDNNYDGVCWTRINRSPFYAYNRPKNTDADDWLITPPINLEGGKKYTFSFASVGGLGEFYPKRFIVTVGSKADFESHKALKEFNLNTKGTDHIRVTVSAESSGEYYIGIRDVSTPTASNLSVTNIRLEEKNSGMISGRVIDKSGNPIEKVLISASGTDMKCTSGKDGYFEMDFLAPGSYKLTASKFRYRNYETSEYVNVSTGGNTQITIKMEEMPTYKVTGNISDSDGKAVSGARIKMMTEGENLETYTSDNGSYSFDKVTGAEYIVEIYKLKHNIVRDTLEIGKDTELNRTMDPSILPPHDFKGIAITEGVSLTWSHPHELFRRDNGKQPVAQGGAVVGDDNYLFGTVWRQPATISAISWMTTDYKGPHNEMNLWLLDITPDGLPTNKVLYNVLHAPSNGDLNWSRHELPEPVVCRNGFYLAVSYSYGMASLATADGNDPEWPFIPYVNYRSADYRTNSWTCVDASFVRTNYMIRAEGEGIGALGKEYDYRYELYRLRSGDESDTNKWIRISPETGLHATEYTDDVKNLEKGNYRYALRAIYPGGKQTAPLLTGVIAVDPAGTERINAEQFSARFDKGNRKIIFTSQFTRAGLTDLSGRERIIGLNSESLDISSLENGIYILRANNATASIIEKIIIHK